MEMIKVFYFATIILLINISVSKGQDISFLKQDKLGIYLIQNFSANDNSGEKLYQLYSKYYNGQTYDLFLSGVGLKYSLSKKISLDFFSLTLPSRILVGTIPDDPIRYSYINTFNELGVSITYKQLVNDNIILNWGIGENFAATTFSPRSNSSSNEMWNTDYFLSGKIGLEYIFKNLNATIGVNLKYSNLDKLSYYSDKYDNSIVRINPVSFETVFSYYFNIIKYEVTLSNKDIEIQTMKEIPTSVYYMVQEKNIPVLNLIIKNRYNDTMKLRIAYRFGIKDFFENKEVTIEPNETKSINIVPSLNQEDIRKIEVVPTPTNILVEVNKLSQYGPTETIIQESYKTVLLPYDQYTPVLTDAVGVNHELMDYLVSWVTFNDRTLSEVINKASEKGKKLDPQVKIVGFQPPDKFTKPFNDTRTFEEKDKDYTAQMKLIYDTLREDYQMTYINQPVGYNQSQRIKLPAETLVNKGNCVELAVLFASLIESIEMDPVLVLSKDDGHAVVGWKVPDIGKSVCHLLETNVFGDEFSKVLEKGEQLMKEYGLEQEFSQGIPFNKDGIYNKNDKIIIYDIKKMHINIPPSPYVLR
jgi:hypothetical protein